MSDESEVTPLRLKRLREVAAVPSQPVVGGDAQPSGDPSPVTPAQDEGRAAPAPTPPAQSTTPLVSAQEASASPTAEAPRRKPVLLPSASPFGDTPPAEEPKFGEQEVAEVSPVIPLRYKQSAVPMGSLGVSPAVSQNAPFKPQDTEHEAAVSSAPVADPSAALPSAPGSPDSEALPIKLRMSTRLQPSSSVPPLPPMDQPAGVPFPMGGAPAGSAAPRALSSPPMPVKGLPTIFVPVDENGLAPPLVPLMSKSAQATIGTRPPMILSSRGGAATAGKADALSSAKFGGVKKRTRARRDRVVLVLFLLLLVGGGGGLLYYLNPWGTTDTVNALKAKLDAAAELPGEAVGKAQKAMDLAREKNQAKMDAVMKGEETSPYATTPAPSPAHQSAILPTNGGAAVEIADTFNRGPATQSAGSPLEPSPEFVKWSDELKITGVYQGVPARALIDRRLVRQGEVIEPVMGVKFVGVDARRKHLILQDESGAQVRLKY